MIAYRKSELRRCDRADSESQIRTTSMWPTSLRTKNKLNVYARGWKISSVSEWQQNVDSEHCWKASPTMFYKQTDRPRPHESKMWMGKDGKEIAEMQCRTDLSRLTDHQLLKRRPNLIVLNWSTTRQPATASWLSSEITTTTVVWFKPHRRGIEVLGKRPQRE